MSAIQEAIENRDIHELERVLRTRNAIALVNQPIPFGPGTISPLEKVIYDTIHRGLPHGVPMIQLLLQKGADIHMYTLEPILFQVIANQRYDVLDAVLAFSKHLTSRDLNTRTNIDQDTFLNALAKQPLTPHLFDTFQKAVAKGANLNQKNPHDGNSPLFQLVNHPTSSLRNEMIQWCLAHGANIHLYNRERISPLLQMIMKRDASLLEQCVSSPFVNVMRLIQQMKTFLQTYTLPPQVSQFIDRQLRRLLMKYIHVLRGDDLIAITSLLPTSFQKMGYVERQRELRQALEILSRKHECINNIYVKLYLHHERKVPNLLMKMTARRTPRISQIQHIIQSSATLEKNLFSQLMGYIG